LALEQMQKDKIVNSIKQGRKFLYWLKGSQ
jgi:hypothetical protein